jgi:hypothetical protein
MELLQREEMQLNGACAERRNAIEWSLCREKKMHLNGAPAETRKATEWLNGREFPG